MSCDDIRQEIPLYCYGEVSSETEERIEAHLASCDACREELARHRAFLEMMDGRPEVNDPGILAACRQDLRRQIQMDNARPESGVTRAFDWLRNLANVHIPFRVPVGAMALVALGFFGARYTPERFGGVQATLASANAPMFSTVRSVEPVNEGGVQIAFDEVRRHVVSGRIDDPRIQELLLSGVREETNAGVRVESIHQLSGNADSEQVRRALLDALAHDPSAGVRLKALEGLKQWAGDAEVRRTLAAVLLHDDNPGVRVQAIDLLTTHRDDSIVGVLQDVVRHEDNGYVRARSIRLLEDMKASVGTY